MALALSGQFQFGLALRSLLAASPRLLLWRRLAFVHRALIAAATGGATVVAGGLVDRMQGEQDLCGPTLEAARNPTVAKK